MLGGRRDWAWVRVEHRLRDYQPPGAPTPGATLSAPSSMFCRCKAASASACATAGTGLRGGSIWMDMVERSAVAWPTCHGRLCNVQPRLEVGTERILAPISPGEQGAGAGQTAGNRFADLLLDQ